MSSLAFARRLPLRAAAVGSVVALLLTAVWVDQASAHGSVIDPPSRNYGCWLRWGSDFQNPNMATQDPMCWQAWQDNPNAMWNWNGLYIDGAGGDHQAAAPDGQLCSAGQTQDGRYRSMDTPGRWTAAQVNNNFTLRLHDQALHGADYFLVYVTRQGYDPVTEPLTWADLELRAQTGVIPPGQGQDETDPVLNGVTVSIDVSAPGRTGRHVVYTIWQASHSDQSYYICSDVVFPGGPSEPPPSSPPPSSPPPSSPPASTSPPPVGTGSCTAGYVPRGQWPGGFQAEVQVTAGTATINGWRVGLAFPNGQTITSIWSGQLSGSGSNQTASNVAYNGRLTAGQSTTFGFLGSWNGTNNPPSLTCTAT
jgi:predicted carbohydrate-binding protein with CBM5 and CBM33 domain